MFNICSRCGQYHADKEIDPSGPFAICPECGERHHFRMLPLLLICGPSGGGKSAVLRALLCIPEECQAVPSELPGKVESAVHSGGMPSSSSGTAVLLEGDLLWRPEFNQPEDNYRDFYETWLRMAKNINQSGRPVALFNAGAIPPNVEPCIERRYFSETHYLALVCDDDVLEDRLRARPSWRESADPANLAAQIGFNQWLKENAAAAEPPVDLLDTTDAGEEETAAAVAFWIREKSGGR